MMKPIEEPDGPPLVPVPPERWRARRLLPSLGFVGLFVVHEALGCVAAALWYRHESIVPLQAGWYALWEGLLLAWFVRNQFKLKGWMGPARLTAFWLAQAAWFGLGLWCFGVLFDQQPFAVEGVGAWLFAAYVLAALCEHAGRREPERTEGASYFDELMKHPMSEE